MAQNKTIRIYEVDGIRGWAAVVVLLFHSFGEMLKFAVPEIHSSLIAPLFSGELAVMVFFVLSGDALSSAFFAAGEFTAIDRLLVKRYFRLTIPIAISCMITYLMMSAGLDYHKSASEILQRPDWLGQFLQIKESFVGLLRYSLIGVYVSHTRELSYNPFLWTMSIEMVGSLLVFLFCYLWNRLNSPQWICIVLILWLVAMGSFFSLFFAGMLLGYYRQQGYIEKLLQNSKHQYLAMGIVVGIASMMVMAASMNKPLKLLPAMLLMAILLVFCFYTQRYIKAFFSNKLSLFLGEISFPLYLVHFQVLISLMSWLVVRDYTAKGRIDQLAMIKFACIAVMVSLIAAWCFRWCERIILKQVDALVLRTLSRPEFI